MESKEPLVGRPGAVRSVTLDAERNGLAVGKASVVQHICLLEAN